MSLQLHNTRNVKENGITSMIKWKNVDKPKQKLEACKNQIVTPNYYCSQENNLTNNNLKPKRIEFQGYGPPSTEMHDMKIENFSQKPSPKGCGGGTSGIINYNDGCST